MSNTIVPSVYNAVMKDVIENVKKDFKDSGIEDAVLDELERNWLQKLKSFKVAPWSHIDGNVGEETNGSTTNAPYILPANTRESITNASLKYLPTHEFDIPPPAADLLSLAINSDATPNGMRKPQTYMAARTYNNHINNQNHLNNNHHNNNNSNSSNSNNNSLTPTPPPQSLPPSSSSSITPTPPPQSLPPSSSSSITPITQPQSLPPSSSSSITPIPPLPPLSVPSSLSITPMLPQLPISQKAYPDTYEKKRKDGIIKRKFYGDGDDINSDLDDSDEDEGAAEGESQNIILCLYDKVSRTKNKWKCQLKDGIMLVNGKEYLFQKGNGDFEF